MDMAENGDPNVAQYMKRLAKEVMETTGLEGGLRLGGGFGRGGLTSNCLKGCCQ